MPSIKAINGNVFAIRDESESSRGGVEFSERVKVKSLDGTISFIDGDCNFAKHGDRVHIPHYGVNDIEFDGTEYAMFKAERIFMVNAEPVNGYVMVRKCEEDHVRDEDGEIALYMTDNHIENTNWVEVIQVSKDCKKVNRDHVGLLTPLPESDERLARVGDSKEFCVHEDLVKFLIEGD